MATLSTSGISAALNVVLADQIADQFRRDSVLLNLLEARPASGANLVYPVKFSGRSAQTAYAEGADMGASDFDSHTRVQASVAWAGYRAGVQVSDESVDIAAATPNGLGGDLLNDELKDAVSVVSVLFGADCYAGDETASPTELAGAARIIDSSGTVLGINPGTYSDWASTENTLATASLSLSKIRELLFRPVINATGRHPDFVTCDGATFDAIKDLFQDNADTVQEVRTANGMIDIYAAAGARAVFLDGVPVVEDRHCTASTLYAWTRDAVMIRYVPPAPQNVTPAEISAIVSDLTGMYIAENDVQARLRQINGRLQPIVAPLSKDGASTKMMVRTPRCQLQWRRRDAFAKLTLT